MKKLSPAMKRLLRRIGDAWLLSGYEYRTLHALIERGLLERVGTVNRRGTLLTKKGVDTYLEIREEKDG